MSAFTCEHDQMERRLEGALREIAQLRTELKQHDRSLSWAFVIIGSLAMAVVFLAMGWL